MFKRISVNKVVQVLTISDILILSGFGLITPIFAVFITDQIQGGDLEAVGLASTIYFLIKSGFQIPLAQIVDRTRGERDDFWMTVVGSLIISLTPILYIFIRTVPQLFLVQAIYGVGGALFYPPWLAIFTRHVDKEKTGWEWSIYYTSIDLSGALAAGLGGFLAEKLGFKPLFLLVSLISFLGSFWLFKVSEDLGIRRPPKKSWETRRALPQSKEF